MNRQQELQEVMGSGLFSTEDEGHFSWAGCDVCANNLGNIVYDAQGYRSLADSCQDSYNRNTLNRYEFQVCGDCLCQATN